MTTDQTKSDLRATWLQLQQAEPHLRNRDAAARLGVSEAELLASACGHEAVRLDGDFGAALRALPDLGVVMALTRSHQAVIEKVGTYGAFEDFGRMGQVLGEDIDLRLFLHEWAWGFALRQEGPRGVLRSLQFFDRQGEAVHKIFLRPESDGAAYDALVAARRAAEQAPVLELAPPAPPPPPADVDAAALRSAWDGMRDTHDFFAILRSFQLGRLQAMHLAGPERARPIAVGLLQGALERAAQGGLPIMVFVGSRGAVQIHKGPIEQVKVTGDWLNVLDPGFNLHVHRPGLATLWVVRKPTDDGVVTSLEAYDAAGELALQLFGRRKPGQAELPAWRALAEGLCER